MSSAMPPQRPVAQTAPMDAILESERDFVRFEVDCSLDDDDGCFGGFLQSLESGDLDFYMRGKNPGVQCIETGRRFRLRTLGLFPKFLDRLCVWDGVNYGSDLTEEDCDLLRLRTQSYRCNSSDLPKRHFGSIRGFVRALGISQVSDAMVIAERNIDPNRPDLRLQYFMDHCQQLCAQRTQLFTGIRPYAF
jgi:hypothetical protein